MNKNNKKGAAQGGAVNAKDPADAAKQLDYLGSARGYTQNFGPARQSGYQKGAAKVDEIMGKGAAQQTYNLDAVLEHGKKLHKAREAKKTSERNLTFVSGVWDSIKKANTGEGKKALETYGPNYGKEISKGVIPQTEAQKNAYLKAFNVSKSNKGGTWPEPGDN